MSNTMHIVSGDELETQEMIDEIKKYHDMTTELSIEENDIKLDISIVTTVDVDEWLEASKDIYGIECREATMNIIRNLDLNNMGFSFILVKHDDKIIGRAIINYQHHSDSIMGFIVDYEYRGIGVGKILMEFIIVKYSKLLLSLTFSSVNPVMWELAINLGFIKIGDEIDDIARKPSKRFLYIRDGLKHE